MTELPPTQVIETVGPVSPSDLRLTKTFIDVCMKGRGTFKPDQITLIKSENLPAAVRKVWKDEGEGNLYKLTTSPSTYLGYFTPEPKARNFASVCAIAVPEADLNWVYAYQQVSGELIPEKKRAGLRANRGVAVIPRNSEYKLSVEFRLGFTIVQAAVLSDGQKKSALRFHELVDQLEDATRSKRKDKK